MAKTLAIKPAPRTKGQLTGHYAGQLVDFALHHWFRLIVAGSCLSVAYSGYVFTHRFPVFSEYLYETMELRGTLS